ncbi:amidohydrolase family protein [Aerococcaceae bacterium NML191219]|nr:amidohydrolase family protein [Aerococcaceae bacterium NML191219]
MKAYVHANIVTCDAGFNLFHDGMLIVDQGKIQYVGAYDVERLKDCQEIINYQDCWLMPGLVNTHTHTPMNLLRGIQDDAELHEWLTQYIWPAESQFTPEITTLAVETALIEMLKSGTTTFNDMYNPHGVDIEQIYRVVRQSKMRCYFSPTLFSSEQETTEQTISRTRHIIEQILAFNDERFNVMVAPHSPYTCHDELLQQSLLLAQQYALPIHIHVAETQTETAILLERSGKRPIAYLQEFGYLQHPSIFAHGVELTDEEIQLLAQSNTVIAHNPISNLKLASGIAPITELLQAGVTVGLATDSVASNNSLDLFEEAKCAALLQKMRRQDARAFNIETVLRLMTIEGAKALRLDKQIGSLEVDKQADFLVINPHDKIHLQPVNHMLSHLVYAVRGGDVQDVYIGGECVVRHGSVLTLDESETLARVQALKLT